jgi:pyruvate,orthophosphate dikinase
MEELLKVKSKALEVNLAEYHIDVVVDAKYAMLQQVMSKYYGLMEGLNTFLAELSHPLRNWRFIVTEARKYSLEYFHLLKNHPKGPEAARLLIDIFIEAVQSDTNTEVKADAIDNLILFLQKIIKDSGPKLEVFSPVIRAALDGIHSLPDPVFEIFTRSYYQITRIAEAFLNGTPAGTINLKAINLLLLKYYQHTYNYWLNQEDPLAWFKKEAD